MSSIGKTREAFEQHYPRDFWGDPEYESIRIAFCSGYEEHQAATESATTRYQEAVDVALEALAYIEQRQWVAETPQAKSWVNEFCEVARKSIATLKALRGE